MNDIFYFLWKAYYFQDAQVEYEMIKDADIFVNILSNLITTLCKDQGLVYSVGYMQFITKLYFSKKISLICKKLINCDRFLDRTNFTGLINDCVKY